MSRRVPFILTCIFLVIVVAGFIIYYIQVSGTIKERDGQISELQGQLTLADDEILSLESDLASVNNQISSLESDLTSANNQISSLESDLTSATTQNTQLESQITEMQNNINDLRLIAYLFKSTTVASQAFVTQPAGQSSLIVGFEAYHAGYVDISGTSNTTSGYIQVTNMFHDYPYNDYEYEFGRGNTLKIPVLPGMVRVYFGNSNATDGASATITVEYVY